MSMFSQRNVDQEDLKQHMNLIDLGSRTFERGYNSREPSVSIRIAAGAGAATGFRQGELPTTEETYEGNRVE